MIEMNNIKSDYEGSYHFVTALPASDRVYRMRAMS